VVAARTEGVLVSSNDEDREPNSNQSNSIATAVDASPASLTSSKSTQLRTSTSEVWSILARRTQAIMRTAGMTFAWRNYLVAFTLTWNAATLQT
jgi:hypothetical protein